MSETLFANLKVSELANDRFAIQAHSSVLSVTWEYRLVEQTSWLAGGADGERWRPEGSAGPCHERLNTYLFAYDRMAKTMERMVALIHGLHTVPWAAEELPPIKLVPSSDGKTARLQFAGLAREAVDVAALVNSILSMFLPAKDMVEKLSRYNPSFITDLAQQHVQVNLDVVLPIEQARDYLSGYEEFRSGWFEKRAIQFQSCASYKLKTTYSGMLWSEMRNMSANIEQLYKMPQCQAEGLSEEVRSRHAVRHSDVNGLRIAALQSKSALCTRLPGLSAIGALSPPAGRSER